MAASEHLDSDSLTLSKCGPCLIDHKDNEASMFCVECNDMLFDSCVAIHRRFPMMRNHKIVASTDKEQFGFTAIINGMNCFGEFEMQTTAPHFQKKENADIYDIKIGSSISHCELPKEQDDCVIQGISLMKNGHMVLSDLNNRNLKLYSQNLKEEKKISLPGHPRDICLVGDDICISYMREHKLQIASFNGTSLQEKQTIEIGKVCRGVSYKNRKLFVACGEDKLAEVHVYSLEGKLIRIFDTDSKGNKMFCIPYCVNTNSDGSLVFVGDNIEGVFALTVDGTLVWRYNDQKMIRGLWNIAVDENDDLYICEFFSNNIVKISSNGQTAEIAVNGIDCPMAICYDRQGRLVVACYTTAPKLQVYQVIKSKG